MNNDKSKELGEKALGPQFPAVENQEVNEPLLFQSIRRKLSETKLPRRDFLIAGGMLVTALGIKSLKSGSIPFATELGALLSPHEQHEQETRNGKMVLGDKEEFFQKEMIKVLNWVPDGPITYWTTAQGKRRYLLTGGQDNATYLLETEGKTTLRDGLKSGKLTRDSFKEVYSPDENVEYKKHYVGITSVLQMNEGNLDHLLGVAHCEQRVERNASGTFTATVELVESNDGGLSWTGIPLITGMEPQAPGERASGAGQPTAIYNKDDGYAYILYIDWAAGKQVKHKDQIYLARIKADGENSIRLEQWTNEGFSIDNGNLKSVIPVPDSQPDFIYTALPSLSWNEELSQYVCTGECDKGFWFSKSKNLTDWSEPEVVYDFSRRGGKPHSILQIGEKWDSYPTALDESKPNSHTTGKNGIFYHSSGDNVIAHEPATLDFKITL